MTRPILALFRGKLPLRAQCLGALPLGVLSVFASSCVQADDDALSDPELGAAEAPLFAAEETPGREEKMALLFESKVRTTDDEEIVSTEVVGEVDDDIRDRVARPYRYVDEPFIYSEEAWSRVGEDGVTERGYRIYRQTNPSPRDPNPKTSGPPTINDNVARFVAKASADTVLQLDLKLRNFPEWNVPLAPVSTAMSPTDVEARIHRRTKAIAEREALFDGMAANIVAEVQKLGGRVTAHHKKGGWLGVEVPATAFAALAANEAIARIDGPYEKDGGETWGLGIARQDPYLAADTFIEHGYTGETANPARHTYGDITIGMDEFGGFEVGACAFKDGAGCAGTSRIRATSRCDDSDGDGNFCEPGAVTCPSGTCSESHGTLTTSVAIGDYTGGQGNGRALGDPSWVNDTCTSSADCGGRPCENGLCAHSSAWESRRTGMAPEASAVLFGRVRTGSQSSSLTDMFDDTIDLNLDISSNSWLWGNLTCDIDSSSALEDEIENAYDDGTLVVFAAGNVNGDEATACQIRDPADTPKVLTVNAYDAGPIDCTTNPSTRCLLDRDHCSGDGCSARGGASANVAGRGVVSNAVSVVDLVAPNNITSVTTATSSSTDGSPTSTFVGTSAATPHVAGLAALVKSQYINGGEGWVNSPGRLHTIMLAMGDRHFSNDPSDSTVSTDQLTATPDPWYGVGRAHLRLLRGDAGIGPFSNNFVTHTFTANGTVTYYPFTTQPMPSGITLVKCVAMQVEDMSSKSNISETRLTVRVRPNAGATCTGTATASRVSNNYDTKKVAALEGFTFTNRCVEVQLQAENLTSVGVTVHTMCYYAGVNDDAP